MNNPNKEEVPNMASEQKQMEKIASDNFEEWSNSLKEKNPEKMADFYEKGNVFHPTLDGRLHRGKNDAARYFDHFLKNDPVGKLVSQDVLPLGPDMYHQQGVYEFEIGPKDKREIRLANYSYDWRKDESGRWKIVHHHSALVEGDPEANKALQTNLDEILNQNKTDQILEQEIQPMGDKARLKVGIYRYEVAGQEKFGRFTLLEEQDEQGNWNVVRQQLSARP